MKIFSDIEIEEAYDYARAGGQALHLHQIIADRNKAPRCFVQAVDRGEDIAHLFDQDYRRLFETARKLGVKIIVAEGRGTHWQHIDLCGTPLKKAIAMAEKEENESGLFESEGE